MNDGTFRFREFSVRNALAAQKVGTDAVLLGAAMTLPLHASALQGPLRLLDIGTGTGVIALMAAQRLSHAGLGTGNGGQGFVIDAIDIDPSAAKEASDNFEASPWAASLRAEAVALRALCAGAQQYNAIFSNPPFFESSLKAPDARRSAARHTDTLSYREIAAFASEHLCVGGTLSLILPSEIEALLLRTAKGYGLHPFRLLRIRTTPAKPFKRVIAEFRLSEETQSICEEELTLMEAQKRTAAYSALTADFYL